MMFIHPQPSDGFEWTQEPWGAALRCRPLGAVADHLFTTGNMVLVHDPNEWRKVAERMGVEPDRLRLIRQVHGVAVSIVRAGDAPPVERPEADVIVSDDPSVAIGVRVADCAPVLIADRRLGVVGAAHAGWRGTVQGAAVVAVRSMVDAFGSTPGDLITAIGPCLGACCGEVGPEVVDAFRDAGHGHAQLERWFSRGVSGRPYMDLGQANRDQLESAGVPPEQIHVSGICTRTHANLLHSYRAQGPNAGRMAGVLRARAR